MQTQQKKNLCLAPYAKKTKQNKTKQNKNKTTKHASHSHTRAAQVDEGLENRKAAYEAMNTLLETCVDRLDVSAFIAQLVEGLKDPSYDIKMLSHLMVIRLANSAGAQLLESLGMCACVWDRRVLCCLSVVAVVLMVVIV